VVKLKLRRLKLSDQLRTLDELQFIGTQHVAA
jgi:hypothetical protein